VTCPLAGVSARSVSHVRQGASEVSEEAALSVPDLPRRNRLEGRTAIITGAGSAGALPGTGAAMAVLFASEGADVVVLDIDEERALHTQEAVKAVGGRSAVVVADITDPAACRQAAAVAVGEFGRVDVLINNAAIAPGESENTDELWGPIHDLNLRGANLMVEAVLPQMQQQGSGSVVMISSIAALRAGGGPAYSAAKAGMIGLAKALAFKHGRSGIRFNVVAPGHLTLPMALAYKGWRQGTNALSMRMATSLLGIEGNGWDVAYTALFFASDESRYLTAVTVPVDGGATEVMPMLMHQHFVEAQGEPGQVPDTT
jgi:NAD(P)-dependent dehydrogenase (short-subunit alcohol dehydrogenase family)